MFKQPKRVSARLTLRERARESLDYAALSDVVLAVRARDGDARALEVLVERHDPGVRRLARYLLSDPQDAEDAAQDALAKLCVRVGQFRGEAAFATWLHSLVANTCRDMADRQRRRRHQPLELVPESVTGDHPQEAAVERDERRQLAACLADLSSDQRHVMVMKDVLALSYEQIADRLGMPVGTVKCHAHRGRARMRRALTPEVRAAGA
ncbi:MAG TPA: RNA polymerase sigma factor [Gaiellales bacterium]|nr:RNA polymerase sigma factor [Gaiellales bacterium]